MAFETAQQLRPYLPHTVIIMLGAPLAGKGYQSTRLSKLLQIPAISTGDLFRAEAASGSVLGNQFKAFMEAGQLIPNDLTTSFLRDKLAEPQFQHGLILDGYPRDCSHLEILQQICNDLDRSILAGVYLEVPEDILRARLSNRLICSACLSMTTRQQAAAASASSSDDLSSLVCPSCSKQGSLTVRADDTAEKFERRMGDFTKLTVPLVETIKEQQLLVHVPAGMAHQEGDSITSFILGELLKLKARQSDSNMSAFKWLEDRLPLLASLSSSAAPSSDAQISQLLLEYRDRALLQNLSQRSGVMRRLVFLQTSNLQKYAEHVAIFGGLYGLEVLRLPNDARLTQQHLRALLQLRSKDLVPLAVIREESNLLRPNSSDFSTLRHGVRAVNRSTMTAISLNPATQTATSGKSVAAENDEAGGALPPTSSASPAASASASASSESLSNIQKSEGMSEDQTLIIRHYVHETIGHIDLTKRYGSTSSSSSSSAKISDDQVSQHPTPLAGLDPVFGWDDIFVVDGGCGLTYHQLRAFGVKHSSRDMVISEFLRDVIYYRDLLQLNFTKLSSKRPVDFALTIDHLVDSNELYHNPIAVKYGFTRLIDSVKARGSFLRRAINRRQNTYWMPGTNGGIPTVKKADKIHEDTFRAHDLGHCIIPDLVYAGRNSTLHRRAYIAWRMISEATTMAIADMLFVDSLKRSGIEYDFEKRRIYPLFRALGIDFGAFESGIDDPRFIEELRRVVFANYKYCLRGDDGPYRQLIAENRARLAAKQSSDSADNGSSSSAMALTDDDGEVALQRFKDKFMPFFVEDFRWTEHNYDNQVARSEEFARWWRDVLPLRQLPGLEVESIDDFLVVLAEAKLKESPFGSSSANSDSECKSSSVSAVHAMIDSLGDENEEAFIDRVFDVVFDRQVVPALLTGSPSRKQMASTLTPTPLPSASVMLFRAFTRWTIGQLAICSKFHFVPESKSVCARITHELSQICSPDTFSLTDVARIRGIYEEFLSVLAARNLISRDDQRTFAEVYPLFDPLYVSYDQDLASYPQLSEVSRRIFATHTHLGKQLDDAQRAINGGSVTTGRILTTAERNYMTHMYRLIEAGDGQVLEGLFVSRPGVMLLSYSQVPPASAPSSSLVSESDLSVTFLIAGVALETSLELIAHAEASVARLTSSKTTAMNVPLYRVQGGELESEGAGDTSGQRAFIKQMLRHRAHVEGVWRPRDVDQWGSLDPSHKQLGVELFNMTQPAVKATALCYTMTLGDLHNLFIGRMGQAGNEYEVRHVVRRMATVLHSMYPCVIREPDWYEGVSNKEKLNSTNSNVIAAASASSSLEIEATSSRSEVDGVSLVVDTVLTPSARALFRTLNICSSLESAVMIPDYLQLSEFRSRITYLAFPSQVRNPITQLADSEQYIRKMIYEFGHRSVLAACQVGIAARLSTDEAHALNPSSPLWKYLTSASVKQLLAMQLQSSSDENGISIVAIGSVKRLRATLMPSASNSNAAVDASSTLMHRLWRFAASQWPLLFVNPK